MSTTTKTEPTRDYDKLDESIPIPVRIPRKLWEEYKAKAAEDGRTPSNALRRVIEREVRPPAEPVRRGRGRGRTRKPKPARR